MEMVRSKQASMLVCVLASLLVSQNAVLTVMSAGVEDQKNFFYSHDPHSGTGSTPTGSHGSINCINPPHDSHTPSTPSHDNPSPSHNPTPSTPSYNPTPSHNPTPHNPSPHNPTPSNPTPHYNPSPSPPSGGGSYHSPPTSGGSHPTPSTPSVPSSKPSPPSFDPNHPFPGTCNFWRSHPSIIWGVVGWWGSMGSAFGSHSIPGFPSSLTFPQALSNTRTDGLGALYREGTASLLNSMVTTKFPFSTQQVRDSFVASLGSEKTAAAQARVFQLANEGQLKPRA